MNTSYERSYRLVDLNKVEGLRVDPLPENDTEHNCRSEQGEGVTFTGDVLHSVHASEDSVFLIVIGIKYPIRV